MFYFKRSNFNKKRIILKIQGKNIFFFSLMFFECFGENIFEGKCFLWNWDLFFVRIIISFKRNKKYTEEKHPRKKNTRKNFKVNFKLTSKFF